MQEDVELNEEAKAQMQKGYAEEIRWECKRENRCKI